MKISQRHSLGNRLISDAQKAVEQHKKSFEGQKSLLQHNVNIIQISIWIKVLIPLVGLTLIIGSPLIYHKLYPKEEQNLGSVSPVEISNSLSPSKSPSKAARTAYHKAFNKKKQDRQALVKTNKVDIISEHPEQEETTLPDPMEKAGELYENGELKEAAVYLKDLFNQGIIEARLPLARVLRELNSPDCIQYYIEEAEAAEGNESLLYEAGMAMIEFDAPLLAQKYAERMIESNLQSYSGLILGANVSEYLKDWEGAVEYLKRALTVRPNSFEDHWQLAWVYTQQAELEAALSQYITTASLARTSEESQAIKEAIEGLEKIIAQIQEQKFQQDTAGEEEQTAAGQPENNITETPLKLIGKHFFVPLVLNNTLEAELMIDTGASITAISPVIAEQLGLTDLEPQGYIQLNTAGGNVEAPFYILPNLQFGGYTVENFRIAVLNSFEKANMTGILGMDLLRYFHFSIDMDDQVLILEMKSTDR